jgi:Rho GTPase-activating protein 1
VFPFYPTIYFVIAVQLLEEKLDLMNSSAGTGLDYLESPVSDGTIEENFEEALVDAPVIESGV